MSNFLLSSLRKRCFQPLLAIAAIGICSGCMQEPPTVSTSQIYVSAARAKAVLPSGLSGELLLLGFEEVPKRSPKSQFRMFVRSSLKDYPFGIPLEEPKEGDELILYFSGPRPVSEEGKAHYKAVVHALQEKLGKENVRANATANTGQALL